MSELHPLVFGVFIGAVHTFGYVMGAWRQRVADRKDIAYVLGMDEESTWGEVQERAQALRQESPTLMWRRSLGKERDG